jgi:pyridoxal phosphate enzyme (YggS family)
METLAAAIRDNIDEVKARIERAARSAGRAGQEVSLVVVTKGQPVETVQAAVEAGARTLGENYPEEAAPKIRAIGSVPGLAWHMIGHLQSRKSGLVAEHFDLFQSLDSLRLARRLDNQLGQAGRALPVMLEFNVSGEESKYGWPAWDEAGWEPLLPEVEEILSLPRLRVVGLMTMPPYSLEPAKTSPYFARLRRLRDFLAARFSRESFRELSMGTSIDFEAAVQEGATLVRIGEAILGPRPPRG